MSSPIDSLPSEILAEIFLFQLRTISFNGHDLPWVLGRVCGRWRAVINMLPIAWSNISVRSVNRYLLRLIIERSKDYPLHIQFQVDDTQLLDMLVAVADRWQEVDFSVAEKVLCRMEELHPLPFPLLEKVTICVQPELEWNFDPPFDHWFDLAPRLDSINLRLPRLCSSLPSLSLSQLKYVQLDDFDLGPVLDKLKNVVECSFHPNPQNHTVPYASLGHLQSLDLEAGGIYSVPVLSALVAPSLQKVRLGGSRRVVTALEALVRRSGCSLTSVHLSATEACSAYLTDFLYSAPSITSLTLDGPADFPEIFREMSEAGDILPHLADLAVLRIMGGIWHIGALEQMLQSRWRDGVLTRFILDFGGRLWMTGLIGSLDSLCKFKELGMDLTLVE